MASQTTFTKQSDVDAQWYVVSAQDQVLGRLAVRVANVLMGKHKPSYTPNADDGDYVIITDCEQVAVTGAKEAKKVYRYHTGYVGGLKEVPLGRMREAGKADQIVKLAVQRMLPKNRLGREAIKKLKTFNGSAHTHAAQKPQPLP